MDDRSGKGVVAPDLGPKEPRTMSPMGQESLERPLTSPVGSLSKFPK